MHTPPDDSLCAFLRTKQGKQIIIGFVLMVVFFAGLFALCIFLNPRP